MSENTKIEWADHSWNPWIGCTKVSPGCLHCYAEHSTPTRVHRAQGRELWGKGASRQRTSAAHWKQPAKWSKIPCEEWEVNGCSKPGCGYADGKPCIGCGLVVNRKRVFPSLCDWLDDEVPIEWLADFLKVIHDTPNIDWLLLTKRPENFAKRITEAQCRRGGVIDRAKGNSEISRFATWLEFWRTGAEVPANVWIGTSVEDQTRADQRIPDLLRIPARVRFLSVEPLLGSVILGLDNHCNSSACSCAKIGWVIVGGESGKGARPCNVGWIRDIVRQCGAAGVACFVKQLGVSIVDRNDAGFEGESVTEWPMDTHTADIEPTVYQGAPVSVKLNHPKGGEPSEWPEDLRLREFPTIAARQS